MNRIKEYLITLLRAYYDGTAPMLDADMEYDRLLELARCHNLCSIVFCVIKGAPNRDIVPADVYEQFEHSFYDSIYIYERQSAAAKKVCDALTSQGIRYIPFKGIVLREMYPVPESRMMGDIDLLISPADLSRAQELLIDIGAVADKLGGNVQEYFVDGIKLELHTLMISDRIGDHDLAALFDNAMESATFDKCRGAMDDDLHFAYLIAHIAHHFWFYGAGAKMILDLAIMLRSRDIDCDRVIAHMERQGLGNFTKMILDICRQWFGIGGDYGTDTNDAQAFLLAYGAFGNMNRNKAAVVQRKEMEQGAKRPDSKLRLLLPPYSRMRELPYIPFIKDRPYMLPAAWVYRIGYNLRHRRRFVMDTVANMGSEQTAAQADEELAFFKQIGLI